MIFLDLETTGFDPVNDRIIEFSAVRTGDNLNQLETLDFLVNPEMKIPPMVSQITGIYDQDTEDKVPFGQRINEVKKFLGEETIWGHNILFDISFLKEYGIAENNKHVDTCDLATVALPNQKSYALEVLSYNLNIEHKYKHRALGDVLACIDLAKIIFSEISHFPKKFWDILENYNGKSENNLFHFILSLQGKELKKNEKLEEKKEKKFQIAGTDLDVKDNMLYEVANFDQALCIANKYLESGYVLSIPAGWMSVFEERFPEDKDTILLQPARQHVSLERLEKFMKQDFFDETESIILLKIIRNKAQKREILERELNIHWGESKAWNKLSLTNEERKAEITKIRKENPTAKYILTHETVFRNKFEIKDEDKIIFLDLDDSDLDSIFGGSVFEESLLNRMEDKDLQDSFASYFENWRTFLIKQDEELDQWGKKTLLEELETNSIEYVSLRNEGLELAVKLYKGETFLKDQAGTIMKFLNSDPAIRFVGVNSKKQITLNVYPLEYASILPSNIINNSSYICLGSTVNKDFSFYKNSLGLEDKEEMNFPNKSVIHVPRDNFPGAKNPEHTEKVKEEILNMLENHKGRMLVLCSSKKQLEELFLKFALTKSLMDKYTFLASGITGGKHKLIHALQENKNAVLFCQTQFAEEIALHDIELHSVVIAKLPYINSYDLINVKRGKTYHNDFSDYTFPKSVIELQRAMRMINAKEVYYLDNAIKNSWAAPFSLIFE